MDISAYKSINVSDVEFIEAVGERPIPVCIVSRDLISGKVTRVFQDDLLSMKEPPFDIGENALFVSYMAVAEFSFFKALGWKKPVHTVDLFVEYTLKMNGTGKKKDMSLLEVLDEYSLPHITKEEKEANIQLILRGGPWSDAERATILDYCESDVTETSALFTAMQKDIPDDCSLVRGEYMYSVACMEHNGIPLNIPLLERMKENWTGLRCKLIDDFNVKYHFFDEGYTRKYDRIREWILAWEKENGARWPRTAKNQYSLAKETLRELCKTYPEILPIKDTLIDVAGLRALNYTYGKDGRNRFPIRPFASKTSRNQPSTSKSIYGNGWTRGLIKPEPGTGIAYIDFCQEEFGIAAFLSDDKNMIRDYEGGDCYVAMGKRLSLIPSEGSKKSHPVQRDMCKTISLAILYYMSAWGLAQLLQCSYKEASKILKDLHAAYSDYFAWSDLMLSQARLDGFVETPLGWRLLVADESNRTLRNFPMQGSGGDILRVACILLTDAEITVLTPVHDAVLIQAPIPLLDQTVKDTIRLMTRASVSVIGHPIRAEAEQIICYPESYEPHKFKGLPMWLRIKELMTTKLLNYSISIWY